MYWNRIRLIFVVHNIYCHRPNPVHCLFIKIKTLPARKAEEEYECLENVITRKMLTIFSALKFKTLLYVTSALNALIKNFQYEGMAPPTFHKFRTQNVNLYLLYWTSNQSINRSIDQSSINLHLKREILS